MKKTYHKNRLQEYCQEKRLALPIYLPPKKTGPDHSPEFQVKVIVNGRRYHSCDGCRSVKEAEQSAAKHAMEKIIGKEAKLIPKQEQRSPPPNQGSQTAVHHLPVEYADIERVLINIIGSMNGRIEEVSMRGSGKRYKIDIGGSNRYCENIKKHHKKSRIYYIVDPTKKTYYQKCYHSTCSGFRSSRKQIIL